MIVPTFNRRGVLAAAVASALCQRVEIEVLVCDDGSEDGSEEVIAQIDDPRVRWLPGPHTGTPGTARNRGIGSARYRWIAFLDSDDRWRPGKLHFQLKALSSHDAIACTSNAWRVSEAVPTLTNRLLNHVPPNIDLREMLRANHVVTSSAIVRADVLDRTGGFPERPGHEIFEDYALWLRVAQISPWIGLDEPLIEYTDDPASSMRSGMRSELHCTTAAMRDFLAWRRRQVPAVPTSLAERLTMARTLVGVMSPRDLSRERRHKTSARAAT